MKNNKTKKVIIYSVSAVVFLSLLFGAWGYGINVGARSEREELTKKLGNVDNTINYLPSDFDGAWYQYTEKKESPSYKVDIPIVSLFETVEVDGETVIKVYSESAKSFIDSKDKNIDIDTSFVSRILHSPVYYPSHRSLDFDMEYISGSDGIVSTFYTVGQNGDVLKMGLKDNVNGVMKNTWLFRLPTKDGVPYIDIEDGEEAAEYARRKLGLPQDEV